MASTHRMILSMIFFMLFVPSVFASISLFGTPDVSFPTCTIHSQTFTLVNSNQPTFIQLSVSSSASQFITFDSPSFFLGTGESREVRMWIRPPCEFEGLQRYSLFVSTDSQTLEFSRSFQAYFDDNLHAEIYAADSVQTCQCQTLQFEYLVRNKGTVWDIYDISLRRNSEFIDISPTSVILQPGQTHTGIITVDYPCNYVGDASFTVLFEARNSQRKGQIPISLTLNRCYDLEIVASDAQVCFEDQSLPITIQNRGLFTEQILLSTSSSLINLPESVEIENNTQVEVGAIVFGQQLESEELFSIRATLENGLSFSRDVKVTPLDVRSCYGLEITPQRVDIVNGTTVTNLTVTHVGLLGKTYNFSILNDSYNSTFQISPQVLELQPLESAILELTSVTNVSTGIIPLTLQSQSDYIIQIFEISARVNYERNYSWLYWFLLILIILFLVLLIILVGRAISKNSDSPPKPKKVVTKNKVKKTTVYESLNDKESDELAFGKIAALFFVLLFFILMLFLVSFLFTYEREVQTDFDNDTIVFEPPFNDTIVDNVTDVVVPPMNETIIDDNLTDNESIIVDEVESDLKRRTVGELFSSIWRGIVDALRFLFIPPSVDTSTADFVFSITEELRLDLNELFFDPDNDTLRFEVNTTLNYVIINESLLVLQSNEAGLSNLTITAYDPQNLSATSPQLVVAVTPMVVIQYISLIVLGIILLLIILFIDFVILNRR